MKKRRSERENDLDALDKRFDQAPDEDRVDVDPPTSENNDDNDEEGSPATEIDALSDFFVINHEEPEHISNEEDCSDSEDAETTNTLAELHVDSEKEEPLFPGCPITSSSSSLLLLKFQMRHNLTESAMSDLLKLIRIH